MPLGGYLGCRSKAIFGKQAGSIAQPSQNPGHPAGPHPRMGNRETLWNKAVFPPCRPHTAARTCATLSPSPRGRSPRFPRRRSAMLRGVAARAARGQSGPARAPSCSAGTWGPPPGWALHANSMRGESQQLWGMYVPTGPDEAASRVLWTCSGCARPQHLYTPLQKDLILC